jgi:hypothetical protein
MTLAAQITWPHKEMKKNSKMKDVKRLAAFGETSKGRL